MTPILWLISHPRVFLCVIMVLNILAAIGYFHLGKPTRTIYFLLVAGLNLIVAFGDWT